MDTIIFTMGLPAAGKSSYVSATFPRDSHMVIDPDAIKEGHEDYDPSNPAALHAWSQGVVETLWADVLYRSRLLSFRRGPLRVVVDGTGTNAEKMVRRINQAKAEGFRTELVYVTCSLETSLRRNRARARNVPEHVVREKALDIQTSFDIVSPCVDKWTIIDNDTDRTHEAT